MSFVGAAVSFFVLVSVQSHHVVYYQFLVARTFPESSSDEVAGGFEVFFPKVRVNELALVISVEGEGGFELGLAQKVGMVLVEHGRA